MKRNAGATAGPDETGDRRKAPERSGDVPPEIWTQLHALIIARFAAFGYIESCTIWVHISCAICLLHNGYIDDIMGT